MLPSTRFRQFGPLAATISAALLLASCAGAADDAETTEGTTNGADGEGGSSESAPIRVSSAYYPLAWVTEQVGGARVEVTDLTPPGSDSHNLELSPAVIDAMTRDDLIVYLAEFQPAVDDAVDTVGDAGPAVYEVSTDADLAPLGEAAADDAHTDDEHAGDDEHSTMDPHFWLDPARLARVADGVAERLEQLDPTGAEEYRDNAAAVTDQLAGLDQEINAGLAQCERSTIVVTHQAYGYLLADTGITQIGISGIDPDTEPSPARIAEIENAVADSDATTIFGEVQVDQKAADVIAGQTGLKVDVLDPLGSQITSGATYPGQMQKNLQALRAALDCA